MNIAIVGTGYVGLVSGTCFAETGNNVVCIDIDENKVLRMQNGEVPIYEPGLEVLFERNTKQGRLSFTTDLAEGIKNAEIIFLALPTPSGADGSADLKYVLKVAEHLSHIITDYKVIVDKSTVPVGTADKVYGRLAANLDESFFDVVSNPEFLREGVAVDDFMRPERVVIGTSSSKAKKVMERLYNPFVRQGNPVIFMDEKSAEMTKYAANSFLATKITFMNEVANLCEEVGANVDMVRKGIGSDSRIGKRFLFPGVGYGGSCFPKDVKALAKTAQENNCDFRILQSVMDVNEVQKSILSRRIKNYFGESIANKTIGIWGLAFKPNTDDIREAPALTIIDELLKAGAQIKAFDPEAMENMKALMGDKIILCDNQYDAIEGADALAVVTEWNVFRTPDYDRIMSSLSEPVVFDGRNVFDPVDMKERGFVYSSIGRP
ncbi:UDP-glucose/GDP-mannose dehydrogenase family protein [Saprospiraceae bacterium]|nr:UDP-glucose/GDP-mannose dehydrogenase family protein [Saprospiraceae bacterium]